MLRGITRNVIALGWVSFFTDLASEMLYPIIPLFVVGTLGAPPAVLGLIEGVAEGISSGLRWVGGVLSDRWGRRKPLVIWGYSISAFSKPLMGFAALAGGWPVFLAGRASDRLGKSVRTAARDALIADYTQPQYRGKAFGFHRAMDTAGAVAGPLVGLVVLLLWPALPLYWLFFIALLPGLASSLLSLLAVRDSVTAPKHQSPAADSHNPSATLPPAFWRLASAVGIFSLGNSSDSFLLLRSREVGLSINQVILCFALYNACYALAAGPLGHLSDQLGRKPLIISGWIVYAAVYAGFAFWASTASPWPLLATYGLYQAMTEGISKAMVSDLVPQDRRAGAIGLLATISGFGQLIASLLAGALWNVPWAGGNGAVALLLGAVLALLAVPVIATVPVHPLASPEAQSI